MFTLETFLTDCRTALQEKAPHAAVREIVARAVSVPGELLAELGAPTKAELTPLYHSTDLTVLKLVWAPNMRVAPHDHRMWAVIGLYDGTEENAFYRRAPVGIEWVNGRTVQAGEAIVLGREVIHAVTNPRARFTSAIHVYGGDFFTRTRSEWDLKTMEERQSDGERTRQFFEQVNRNL